MEILEEIQGCEEILGMCIKYQARSENINSKLS